MKQGHFFRIVILTIAFQCLGASSGESIEFKVQREEVFEFSEGPTAKVSGDSVEVTFASRGRCDATVAVEDASGRIIRHLACGLLGDAAPEPFQKGNLRQAIVWDGKDDQGRYIDDKASHSIRVSLGLRGTLEGIHYWSPYRRESRLPAIIRPAPEGVYVYDGGESLDFIRLFSHEGEYIRTVYPFPADKIEQVKGLAWKEFPQDGGRLPIKGNFLQNSFLTSGLNGVDHTWNNKKKSYESVVSSQNAHFGMYGNAATTLAVQNGKMTLAHRRVQWLGTDGSSGGMDMEGPAVSWPMELGTIHEFQGGTYQISPRSSALSPDGQWLYLTGYLWSFAWHVDGLHGVIRVPVGSGPSSKPEIFLGSMGKGEFSPLPGRFSYPTTVACDSTGRVYVGDYMNDRIQVFSAEGKLLKVIPATKPAHVEVHSRTGDLYVFSWAIRNLEMDRLKLKVSPAVTHLGPYENPERKSTYSLPIRPYPAEGGLWDHSGRGGHQYRVALDSHVDPPVIWISPDMQAAVQLWVERDGKLQLKRDFQADLEKAAVGQRLIPYRRWRLFVDPRTGFAYVGEGHDADGTGIEKAFKNLFEIDPVTGKTRQIELPITAEDMCFDAEGHIYLRSNSHLMRYDFATLREVAWDYGEELGEVGWGCSSPMKKGKALSALPIFDSINWHMGGFGVSLKGNVAASCYGIKSLQKRTDEKRADLGYGKPYQARLYPGRILGGKAPLIHIWNKHGQLIQEDAVPGLPVLGGLQIDKNDYLYVLSSGVRMVGSTPYFNDLTGTLMRFKPGVGRLVTKGNTPIQLPHSLSRDPDLITPLEGPAWVEGADWKCGGVGYFGKVGVGCGCWDTRFALDYFCRAFVPERDRYSVAVVDSNGNVLLRLGRYGNPDSAGPGSKVPIGSDEIALMTGSYVATHTDRRLFISDPGNGRIISVKLYYNRENRISLGDLMK